ncbi:hypothetical protein SBA2_480006 [Acidobacteriia bacterium SbA2]|nr:hypothetical protein SBA2_480006 [Acidobacteriia bacterium SbA2]
MPAPLLGPRRRLHFPAAFHGLQHGNFVGVFDVAAYGNAHGDAGHAQSLSLPLQLLGQVGGGGFAFDGGIGGEDDFFDFSAADPADQVGDAQLLGSYAVQGRNRAVEHVVDAVKMPRLLDCGNVGGFLHDADDLLIPGRAAAVDAGIDVGNVVADRAQTQLGLDVSNRGSEGFGVILARAQNMKGEALGALVADSRQLLEFVDEPGHGFGEFGHRETHRVIG